MAVFQSGMKSFIEESFCCCQYGQGRLYAKCIVTIGFNCWLFLPFGILLRLKLWFNGNSKEGQGKLNVDGCVRLTQDRAGIGGVFRNSSGDWTIGFIGRLQSCTSLESEIWNIYRGVVMANQRNWINLEIESDCLEAVQIFHDERTGSASMMTIIMEGKYLMRRIVGRIKHIGRDANEVANALVNMGAKQIEQLSILHDADKMGVGMFI